MVKIMPKVSIIIPTYNVAPWIEETLKSVSLQTSRDFECIIIDDMSTDDTYNIINEFIKGDRRFKLFRNKKKEGVSYTRNYGIQMSQGKYISFLDGDDIWHHRFLEKMLGIIEKKNAWLSYSRFALFTDKTNIRKQLVWNNLLRTGNIWWDMLMITEFHLCSCLVKSDIVRKIKGFDLNLRIGEDRDFLLQLMELICNTHIDKICGIDEELLFYRQRAGSAVRNAQEALSKEWHMMYAHIEHPGIPHFIRKRAWSFLAFKMAVIASFGAKDLKTAIRWYVKAVKYDMLNINLYWLPILKILKIIFQKNEKIKFYE